MNQLQAEKLKKFVSEEFPERLGQFNYFNGECFCAIGAFMNKVEPKFYDEIDSFQNSESIEYVLQLEDKPLKEVALSISDEFGLNKFDLMRIQEANDNFDGKDEDRSKYVKSFIKDLMKSKYDMLD